MSHLATNATANPDNKNCQHSHQNNHNHAHEHDQQHQHHHGDQHSCTSHNHDHHDHHHDQAQQQANNQKALSYAFWLNFIFSIIELIGGVLTNSTAIITDALHDFTDAIAIGMAVFLEKLSGKPATDAFTYGFKRFSLLSAISMSLFLLAGSSVMVYSAVLALINPEPVHSVGMLGLAVLGVVVNGAAFLNIKNGNNSQNNSHVHSGCGHSHHGGDHNQNSKAIMLHLLEDLLSWVAVLIAAVVIYFTDWYWVDGILTIAIALFVIFNAAKNIKSCMSILLLATPESVDIDKLKAELLAIANAMSIEKLKVWSLDGSDNVASVHLLVDDLTHANQVKASIKQVLHAQGINEVTIELDTNMTNHIVN